MSHDLDSQAALAARSAAEAHASFGAGMKARGAANRARVRAYFVAHPCATKKDCAAALGLSLNTVCEHACAIRRTWKFGLQGGA